MTLKENHAVLPGPQIISGQNIKKFGQFWKKVQPISQNINAAFS
jgi:hypothetical protein